MAGYCERIRSLLATRERRLFERLRSPQSIQDYLETLPVNFELEGETYMSPRRVIREKTAHCFEGALFAAAVLAYHGEKPLLMDFQTIPDDEDHVVALFKQKGFWGAVSKTNHGILRYRDAVYASPRELAMSYFHEYLMHDGRKSLRAFSQPFNLERYASERWITAGEDLHWLVDALDSSPHHPAVARRSIPYLRKASPIELRLMDVVEWKKPKRGARPRRT